jgi:hypothetical protein
MKPVAVLSKLAVAVLLENWGLTVDIK